MYLTRMELNTKNMDTIRLLGSQEKIHGLVESGFLGERKRNLWRLEYLGDRLYLLILSPDRPDLSIGVRRYGFPDDENAYQTKDYTPLLERVKNDTWWHFKLVANPTRSVASTPGERGKVKAHCSLKYQEEWLLDRNMALNFCRKIFRSLRETGTFSEKERNRERTRSVLKA